MSGAEDASSPRGTAGGALLKWLFGVALLGAAVAAPHLVTGMVARHLLVLICINIILVAGLDLLIGGAGLVSLGHAAFMGVGAYSSALIVKGGQPFLVGLLSAIFFAGLAGLMVGLPALRLRGHYFSVVTFIIGIIVTILMTNLDGLTRGPRGLTGIPFVKVSIFGFEHTFRTIIDKVGYYYIVLAFAVLALLVRWLIGKSRFGRALTAIKGDENLAESIGIPTYRVKVTAFMIAAAMAGAAGSLYAHYSAFISPDSFTFIHSFDLFVMNLLGGAGTIAGPVIGPAFLTLVTSELRFLSPALAQVGYGVVLILVIVLLPQGIAGGFRRLVNTVRERRHAGGDEGRRKGSAE